MWITDAVPLLSLLVLAELVPWVLLTLLVGSEWILWIGFVIFAGPTILDAFTRIRRADRGRPAAPAPGEGAVHLGGSLAAWPTKTRAGSTLLAQFTAGCQDAAPVTVDIYPREHLIGFYEGFGFTSPDKDSTLMRRTWTTNLT